MSREIKKIGIIVQARLGSTRLPGKILEELDGNDLLGYLINRLRQVNTPIQLIVATTTNPNDIKVVNRCKALNVFCFTGSETNLVQRYKQAAEKFCIDTIIRIPSDNPFIVPSIIDQMLEIWLNSPELDYFSNILEETFPTGLHIEIFNFKSLEAVYKLATKQNDLEHVTPFIYNNQHIFKCANFKSDVDYSKYRLTVDYAEDLLFARMLAERMDVAKFYNLEELIELIESKPTLFNINSMYKKAQSIRNE